MQQTEQGRITIEDRHELEFRIKCLEEKIKSHEKNPGRVINGIQTYKLNDSQEHDIKELRRLRRMRT